MVTTGLAPTEQQEEKAGRLAVELNAPYAPRARRSLNRLIAEVGAERLLVVETHQLCLRDNTGSEYRFHPNMFLVRGLNVLRGARDLFIEAAELGPGDSVLDCTVGFGCEASLGALVVGETGNVVALESVPELALVTREGMQCFPLIQKPLRAAMQRVAVCAADYKDYLPRAANGSFDIVSFDPFFPDPLRGSEHNINPLAHFGDLAPLDIPPVIEARRVARRRVVIKHPRNYELSEEIAGARSGVVSARRGGIAYTILPAF